jgi:TetR/AcrR family transcriptional regulator, transcriptional repressor for nem operon
MTDWSVIGVRYNARSGLTRRERHGTVAAVRSPEPGRNALLDAGQRLLETADLARISVNAIVAQAGMAKGSFYQHWPSRAAYVRALHDRFHDRLLESIEAAIADSPPGRDRLATAMDTYLDGCLAEPATKALLVQSRTEAGLSDLVAARNAHAAAMLMPDLAALGWDPPEPIAALIVAAVAEIALVELEVGQRDDDLRRGLLRLATRTPAT